MSLDSRYDKTRNQHCQLILHKYSVSEYVKYFTNSGVHTLCLHILIALSCMSSMSVHGEVLTVSVAVITVAQCFVSMFIVCWQFASYDGQIEGFVCVTYKDDH